MKVLLLWCISATVFSMGLSKTELNTMIFEVTQAYGIEYKLMKALVLVESNGVVDAKSYTNDFGLTQISQLQINLRKLNKKRLMIDPKYALEEAAKLLQMHCGSEYIRIGDRCWEKYHSKTPSFRRKYAKKVRAKYKQIGFMSEMIRVQLKEIGKQEAKCFNSPY